MPPALTGKAWVQIRYDYEHTERPIHEICAEHGISTGTLRDRMRRWGWTRRRPPIPREGPPPVPAPRIDERPSPSMGAPLPSMQRPMPNDPKTLPALHEDSPHPAASLSLVGDPPPPEPAPGRAQARPGWEGKEVTSAPPLAAAEAAGAGTEADDSAIVPRLESAVARVLPAIEATVAKLAAGATHPREIEHAGRALGALTRTLRELNCLLSERRPPAAAAPASKPADSEGEGEPPQDIEAFRRELIRRMDAIVEARIEKEAQGDA